MCLRHDFFLWTRAPKGVSSQQRRKHCERPMARFAVDARSHEPKSFPMFSIHSIQVFWFYLLLLWTLCAGFVEFLVGGLALHISIYNSITMYNVYLCIAKHVCVHVSLVLHVVHFQILSC